MRKFTLILSLCALVFSGFAQRAATKVDSKFTFEMPQTVKGEADITDTLVPASFLTGTPAFYTVSEANGGGYVCGANGYGDLAKAQHFNSGTETYLIQGVQLWVGANELSKVTQDSLKFAVYGFDGAPTTELSSMKVAFSQVTTTVEQVSGTTDFWYSVIFDEPVEVTGEFAVGIEFEGLTSGFGLVSTSAGDGGADAWELWSDGGGWYSFLDANSWGLDIDMGIFPLISKKVIDENLIKDGGFATDGPITAPWSTWSGNGGTASVINGVCTMVPAAVSDQWQLQVTQNGWVATNDSSYEFTFTAWSDSNRVFGIDFEDPNNGYNRFGDSYDWDAVNGTSEWQVALTTTPTVYKRYVTFKRIKENTNFLLNIMTSAAIEKVYIDDISLVKIPQIPVQDFNVTFKVDMTAATLAEGDVVYVTGSFNGWDEPGTGESILMTKTAENTWNARALVPAGSGEVKYKYFIGASWNNGDLYNGNGDRLMQVDSAAVNVSDIWNEPTVQITFNVDATDADLVEGDVIYVTGSFAAGWNVPGNGKSVLMTKGTGNIWTAVVPITKNLGNIEYKYFKNASFDNGEPVTKNRALTIADANAATNDVWGIIIGIHENVNNLSAITIYPNPFNGELVISNIEGASQIMVSNVLGQTVMTVNEISNQVVLSTSELNKGVYFVTIIDNNNNRRTERVVKQ